MKPLTAEETVSYGHVLGLSGAVATIATTLATAFTARPWTPPGSLIALIVGLIAGSFVNDYLNTPRP